MIDAISKLVESGAISEDTPKAIQEAWDSKVKENLSDSFYFVFICILPILKIYYLDLA